MNRMRAAYGFFAWLPVIAGVIAVTPITPCAQTSLTDTTILIGNGTVGPFYVTGRPLLSREFSLLDLRSQAPLTVAATLFEHPARLVFEDPLPAGDSVIVAYSALPFAIHPPSAPKATAAAALAQSASTTPADDPPTHTVSRLRPLDLSLSGSKSFGFSVGNNRQSSLQQGLNITLNGKLTKSLGITAALSDQLSDRLSSGATASRLQNLEEFFVELRSPRFHARLGDIQWQTSVGAGRRTRQLAGFQIAAQPGNHQVQASAGELAGQAKHMEFFAQDGYQGPYSISAARERIQPQSERVYLNGQPLTSGQNGDYEIDYFTGEITFSPRIPLTERSRIQVDFEVLDNLYRRRGAALDWSVRKETVTNETQFLWEGDDPDRGVGLVLSPDMRDILSQSSEEEVWVPAEEFVGADNGEYIKHDESDKQFYEYVGPDNGDYNVRFSYVGPGNGAYLYLGGGAYRHVGDSTGDYTPQVKLTAPTRRARALNRFVAQQLPFGSVEATGIAVSQTPNRLRSSAEQTHWSHDVQWSSSPQITTPDSSRAFVSARWRQVGHDRQSARELDLLDIARNWYLPTNDRQNLDGMNIIESHAVLPLHSWIQLGGEMGHLTGRVSGRRDAQRITIKPFRVIEWQASHRNATATLPGGEQRKQLAWQLAQEVRFRNWRITTSLDREQRQAENHATRFDAMQWQIAHGAWKLQHQWEWRYNDLARGRLVERSQRLSAAGTISVSQWGLRGNFYASRLNRRETRTAKLDLRYFGDGTLSWHYRPWNLESTVRYNLNQAGARLRRENYIPVADGFGEYRLEDSLFVPDQQGDFRRVIGTGGVLNAIAAGSKEFSLRKSYAPGHLEDDQWFDNMLIALHHDRREQLAYRQLSITQWLIPWGTMLSRHSAVPYSFVARSTTGTLERRFMQPRSTWYVRTRLVRKHEQYQSLVPTKRFSWEIVARRISSQYRWQSLEIGVRTRSRSANTAISTNPVNLRSHMAWFSAGYSISPRSTLSLTPSTEFLDDQASASTAVIYGFTPALTWHFRQNRQQGSTRTSLTYEYVDSKTERDYIPGFQTIHGLGHNLRANVDARLNITSSISATIRSQVRLRRNRQPDVVFNISAVSKF